MDILSSEPVWGFLFSLSWTDSIKNSKFIYWNSGQFKWKYINVILQGLSHVVSLMIPASHPDPKCRRSTVMGARRSVPKELCPGPAASPKTPSWNWCPQFFSGYDTGFFSGSSIMLILRYLKRTPQICMMPLIFYKTVPVVELTGMAVTQLPN